jgi:N-acetyl-gamma-glutamyl-phosphate reductase
MHKYSAPSSAPPRLRAGLLGYTGYSGAELLGLLQKHPFVAPVLLAHRKAEESLAERRPLPCGPAGAEPVPQLAWEPGVISKNGIEVVFTATPPEVSMEVVPEVLAQGARAIDLSGAFRLPAEQFSRWYGVPHSRPELLNQAVYGLPELYRDAIRTACLVSNPGCYPTAAICALWPLLRQESGGEAQSGWIDRQAGIVCDAKSGVSGAGKKPSPKTHFVQVTENFTAYAILNHRHVPEVLNHLGMKESEFSFTAHLLPIERGILSAHYLRLKRETKHEELMELYRAAYRDSRFIRLYPKGSQPELRLVNRTNFCDIHFSLGNDGERLVVISCIDNLVKGAAGQAVQNLNVMFGLDEAAGLL